MSGDRPVRHLTDDSTFDLLAEVYAGGAILMVSPTVDEGTSTRPAAFG